MSTILRQALQIAFAVYYHAFLVIVLQSESDASFRELMLPVVLLLYFGGLAGVSAAQSATFYGTTTRQIPLIVLFVGAVISFTMQFLLNDPSAFALGIASAMSAVFAALSLVNLRFLFPARKIQ